MVDAVRVNQETDLFSLTGSSLRLSCSYEGRLKEANRLGVKKGLSVGVSLGTVYLLIFLVESAAFW